MLKLNHSCVSLTDIRALLRKNCEVYVWDDEPSDGEPHHIVLNVEDNEGMHCVDLLPHEARAVAALLLAAADHQEALSKAKQEVL